MNDCVNIRLFIAGETSRSQEALANFRQIMERLPDRMIQLEVIDVLEQPERAEQESILATPTLVRGFPLPERRIIGDLRDSERVLRGLGLDSMVNKAEEE